MTTSEQAAEVDMLIRRLERLLRLRREYGDDLNEAGRRLLTRAIDATAIDATYLGKGYIVVALRKRDEERRARP